MNFDYLDTMPEVRNKFKVQLLPGEKVVFTSKPWGFATDTGDILGADDSRITLTNQRLIADNGQGVWITDLREDVVDMRKMEAGDSFWSKEIFILVTMNKELAYGIGINKLNGYRLHFGKKDMKTFENIIAHLS